MTSYDNDNARMRDDASERRKSPRLRALLSATLRDKNKTSTWSCLVRNLSHDGALLQIDNTAWIAKQFELDVPSRDLRRLANVVWREPGQLGICFVADIKAQSRSASETVISLRDKNLLLRHRIDQLIG
jgi:hypothetical protein